MNYSKDANTKKQNTKKDTPKKVKNRVGLIIARIILIVIILVFFAVLGAGMGAYLGIIGSSPDIGLLQVTPDVYTSIIYDENGVEIDRLQGEENREYIKLSEIPTNMQKATVAIEDERFYSHDGIDFKGMVRALVVNIQTMSFSEGASTITQQLIKNNLFTNEKKLQRKLQEQYMAVQLEKQLTAELGSKQKVKEQLLELYLNTINYNGVYGIRTAAKRYFAKDPLELTLAECATLAAIPKSPSNYSPVAHPDKNKERQLLVLKRMLEQGLITQSEHDEAKNEDVYSKIQIVAQEVAEKSSPHSYYVDQVLTEISNDLQEREGLSESRANAILFNTGIQIFTCLDPEIQQIVDEAYTNPKLFPTDEYALEITYYISVEDKVTKKPSHYREDKYVKDQEAADAFAAEMKAKYLTDDVNLLADRSEVVIQPQSAFIVTDYHTGQVKALMGGRGEKTQSRTFNRATQATRQPGSTFKVLAAYAPGIDTGKLTPATVFNDAPYTKGNWSPGNWYSGYRGMSTVRKGIEYSMNIVAAKAIDKVGIDTSFDYLLNFGFTTLVDSEKRADGKVYSDKNDTTVLGGLTDGVILSELNSAYGTIANGGEYLKPIYYTKVLKHDGTVLLENTPEPKTVLKKTTAFLLTDMMEDVITGANGTAKTARFKNIKMTIAGKTGTTSENKDLIFSAYTPYYVASTWLGHDKKKNLVTNGNSHVLLWRDIMEKIHVQKNLENKKFERPEGIETAKICTVSGNLQGSLCSSVITEYFASGTVPSKRCTSHASIKVDTSTNMLANEFCPSDVITYINADSDEDIPTKYCDVHTAESISTEESTTTETESETESQTETGSNGEILLPPIIESSTGHNQPTTSNTTESTASDVETTAKSKTEATTKAKTEATTKVEATKAEPTTKNTEIPINNDTLDLPLKMDDFFQP